MPMTDINQKACTFKKGTWSDFRDDVKTVNLELFNIIEQISPNEKYPLIEAEYLYGEKITDFGTICVPDKSGRLSKLDSPDVSQELKDQLGYCPTPLILQLNRASEVFVESGDRIIPLNVFSPGDLYGLFEAIMPLTGCPISPCWSVTSGGRSVFLGAKVADAVGYKRLRKEFGTPLEAPKKLQDQWHYIKTIGNRSNAEKPWTCKILIFTKPWFENREDNIGWLKFQKYLLVASWLQSKYMRSRTELSITWEAFASAIGSRNLKPNPYILDTIMHNIFLAYGAVPGFKAADDSEMVLPSKAIENAFENIYQLREYASIVMHPQRLEAVGDNSSIYYSLTYPTLLEGTAAIRGTSSYIVVELREIKLLMQTLEKIFEKNGGQFANILNNTNFGYYHTEKDKYEEIAHSSTLIETDSYLKKVMDRFKGKTFPFQGPFFRGCIQISKK